jgi:hypothetical protein
MNGGLKKNHWSGLWEIGSDNVFATLRYTMNFIF